MLSETISRRLILTGLLIASAHLHAQQADISLNGQWQTGIDRQYTQTATVPGLAQDPTRPSPGTLWYKRTVQLPGGDWTTATLTLHGARFAPVVYVNGTKVSSTEGGMAPTIHLLASPLLAHTDVAPGKTIQLEIALLSLTDLSNKDASSVPGADRWRTNISSGLWDSVTLHLSGATRLTHVVPFTDFAADSVTLHWQAEGPHLPNQTIQATLIDATGKLVAQTPATPTSELHGTLPLALHHAAQPWSPEHPNVYKLSLSLASNNKPEDTQEISWGLKDFHTANKRFYLNGEPITLRGGTVVFQRFLRQPEAAQLAFDPDWFQKNIFLRLKGHGANTMRFHLALPPEEFLDLCDRDGLMVQLEWPFFHGIPASTASMTAQWRSWLDVAMRHPSVMIVHGWNETGGNELQAAWNAMNDALAGYPKLVVAHRDTLHIHKYWWSLFENLGLYYDSADQFDHTIMVDEFGGNYLDKNGDPGLYPAVKETFLRFLGREQTKDLRLEFHAESNARVGEYWRRIGAAGVLPFCIIGSPQDGSVWFLGDLKDPKPMPVWDALTATFAPQSVSLDVWDRNYTPGQHVTIPLYLFNDTGTPTMLAAKLEIHSNAADHKVVFSKTIKSMVAAHAIGSVPVTFDLPDALGDWQFSATLLNQVPGVIHPIVSSWDFRTLAPVVDPALAKAIIGVPANEPELLAFLNQNHLHATSLTDPAANVILTSAATWSHLTSSLRDSLATAVNHGQSVVLLDVGPHDLGQGYRKGDLGPLDGAPTLKPEEMRPTTQPLFAGIDVTFTQLPEPESHIQPGPTNTSLWAHMPRSATWIWNGLRGGLIAPADNMEVSGLSSEGFLTQWTGHGADPTAIAAGSYYAYQLAGYYAFSTTANDKATIDALRKRVRFLAEDAPALQAVINPDSTVEQVDLNAAYHQAAKGHAQQLLQLSTCGKNLTRTGVAELSFGPGKGNVILSQAITAGRLIAGAAEPGLYGIRHDPAAEQFVLNMLAQAIVPAPAP